MYLGKSIALLVASGVISILPAKGLYAAVVTNGCSSPSFCTFPELFGGASIQVGDILLTDWNFVSSSAVNLNNMEIGQYLPDTEPNVFRFGLFASNRALRVTNGSDQSLSYQFKVTSLGQPINQVTAGLGFSEIETDTIFGIPLGNPVITGNTNFGTTQGSNNLGTVNGIFSFSQNVKGGTVGVPELNSVWVRNTLSLSTTSFGDVAELGYIPGLGEGEAYRFAVTVTDAPEPPTSVPEPNSTLSLLALGTLGAASTLKRKLKPSKSTEKETTKVG